MMQNTNENTQSQSRVTKVALVVTLLAVVGVVALAQSSWKPAAGHVLTKLRPGKQTDVAGDVVPCGICPYSWQPVCGADGKTYPNECLAICGSVSITCKKACPCGKKVVGDGENDKNKAVASAQKEKQQKMTERMDVKKDYSCPPNMIFEQCGAYPTCQITCQHKTPRPCPLICWPGCVCKPGFIRTTDTSNICLPKGAC